MKLLVGTEWAAKYFGTPPDRRTIRSWVVRGDVPGRVIGKIAYVDEAAWLAAGNTGDDLADAAIKKLAS